ncbi:pentatricopeptide repeat-containing protein At5g66520-like [Malania oleifera]|uniref:pentatricopeptide repeat-containing protein At5g66520-like n=1 Tax=Malania oleifera TaxID=397392 RepID=UPI0025AE0AFB|nr:pentatricopeptide repeat-containing protein At5g66520-like [Malania oleifera]
MFNHNALNSARTHHPHGLSFTSIFHRCKSMKEFKQTHTQLIVRGLPHPPPSLRPTISFSSLDPFGDIDYALLLLLQPSTPPLLFLFNTVIRGLARSCHRSKSVSSSLLVFERMGELNLSPNSFTFTFLFQVCSNFVYFDLGRLMHCVVIKNSFVNDVFVRNSMIRFYSVSSELGDARGVFDESPVRDVVSWNSMINGYLGHGDVSEALELFGKMPNRNDVSWNSLLGGFVKFGCVGDAYRLFVAMPQRNLVSWVLMISGYAQNGQPKEALELFREMQLMDQEWTPNSAILVSVLSACSQLGALDHGNWVHTHIKKKHVNMDSILSAALIDMYAKCGSIDFAMQVFSSSGKKDVSVYTAAISGLATNGRSREALQLFEKMKVQGISPDGISYIAVLCACSQMGCIEEGFKYFASMSSIDGIRPELDHYACMVDLLGRAGMLEEAENFVASMPIMPDAVIWGALLGACRVHGNTEMGQRIGNILIASDQNNDGRYILLSNIYAESMKGKDAEEVRKAMRSRKLKRIPGCSLIEVDGIFHEFFAGDRLHEKKEEIYLKWEAIVKQIKNFGYKEETRGVVFDVEEEEKETIIGYHSEKLAVAFGILCTKPGSMLRIVKNIRICNDCHSAIKLVSKVFKRKISVRDRKLFHHFENGSCSCKDYW